MTIYEYEDSLGYKIAVMQAAKEGQPVEFKPKNPFSTDAWAHIIDPSWDWSFWGYRIAKPNIAEGHNPDGLTEDQVGVRDGWRLLAKEEISIRREFTRDIQGWCGSTGWDDTGWAAVNPDITFRTKKPAGHFLPKKEEPKKKTIKDWLNELPSGYRERALKNCSPGSCGEPKTLREAIEEAFFWFNSPEGYDFWYDVSLWADNPENHLPPLPPSEDLPEPQPPSLEDLVKALEAIVKDLANKEKE